LFALVSGEVWHKWWWRGSDGATGWSDWHMLTRLDMHAVDIASSSVKDGHMEVFAIDGSGRLRHRWYWRKPGWSNWEDMPVPPKSPITAITAGSHSDRHQELFALTVDGKIHHAWNWLADDGRPDWTAGSEWSPWHEMPTLR
jgi:hypothetical protein